MLRMRHFDFGHTYSLLLILLSNPLLITNSLLLFYRCSHPPSFHEISFEDIELSTMFDLSITS